MTRSAASALRLLATLALVAAIVVLAASVLAGSVSAAPRDDVGGVGDDIVVVDDPDDPTETPLTEPDPALTPVAIPSVSPEPTRDPFDVTGDQAEEVYDDPGTGDMVVTAEVCDPIVPGQVNDMVCSPAASAGYDAYLYSGTSNQDYTIAYQGALPADLPDLPAGPYMLSVGPIPVLMQFEMVCRVESPNGDLIQTLTGTTFITLSLGYDAVARCTVYLLPEGELPDELAPIESTDGPVELIITDFLCPAGTDPALNYFGLIGRCPQSDRPGRWEARGAAGGYETGDPIDDGVVSMTLTGGVWTVNTFHASSDYPPVLFCNVRDELGNEPPQYAPFLTYQHGQTGAVMTLEQNMTWLCSAYVIPMGGGDGSDVVRISVTKHVCPEGTTAPTVAACAQTLDDVTFHLLFGTQTIVASRATDANGVIVFSAPENLGSFGLAEEVPAGFIVAPYAVCATNGGASTGYPVAAGAIVDLGALTGGDVVDCAWFNVADPTAVAPAPLDLEVADIENLELARTPPTAKTRREMTPSRTSTRATAARARRVVPTARTTSQPSPRDPAVSSPLKRTSEPELDQRMNDDGGSSGPPWSSHVWAAVGSLPGHPDVGKVPPVGRLPRKRPDLTRCYGMHTVSQVYR
jgi:hypothetical protein